MMASDFVFTFHITKGKAQEIKLFLRCCKQEIALVFTCIMCAVKLYAIICHNTADIMPSRHTVSAEITGDL